MNTPESSVKAVCWNNDKLYLLDQRLLPGEVVYLEFDRAEDVAGAIKNMVVRGAPAIGVAAAYAVALAAREAFRQEPGGWQAHVAPVLEQLQQSRPTAVNLAWAINEMKKHFEQCHGDPFPLLLARACAIHEQDINANHRIGQLGAEYIGRVDGVLTHCNAGALATGGYGTALGVIRSAWSGGKLKQVFASETRPWFQGARLTAWELLQDRIPVTVIADSAASYLMKSGQVQWVVVGADRIAANGDVANKIGTYQLAIAARHHGTGFMVAAPTSTIDRDIDSGDAIPIEQRAEDEILGSSSSRIAPDDCRAWNPVFDITPAEMIDLIVTESGIVERPDRAKIRALFAS